LSSPFSAEEAQTNARLKASVEAADGWLSIRPGRNLR
jgi:hypothetical protein